LRFEASTPAVASPCDALHAGLACGERTFLRQPDNPVPKHNATTSARMTNKTIFSRRLTAFSRPLR
jgi:hypothetical protein